jgi:serralysin
MHGGDGVDTVDYHSRSAALFVRMDDGTPTDGALQAVLVVGDVDSNQDGDCLDLAISTYVIGSGNADIDLDGDDSCDIDDMDRNNDGLCSADVGETFAHTAVDIDVDADGTCDANATDANFDAKPDSAEGDNIKWDVENIKGSSVADTLYGNASANKMEGGAGADLLYGLAGDDYLDGEGGTNNLDCGAGSTDIGLNGATWDSDPGVGVTLVSYVGCEITSVLVP